MKVIRKTLRWTMRYCNLHHNPSTRLLASGHVSKILQISPATLRTYELEGLIRPEYKRGKKGYSHEQVGWIACIRHIVQDKGISIPGLIRLLRLIPCWEIAECPPEIQKECKACRFTMRYLDKPIPWPHNILIDQAIN